MVDIHTSLYNFMRAYRVKDLKTKALIRGAHSMTYARFFKEIDKVAGGLFKMGVRKGDVVMLALPNLEQSVIATYACSRIGAIASMIHPKLSSDEFESAVLKLQPKAVFLSEINFKAYYSRCHGAKRVLCPFAFYAYIGLPCSKKFDAYQGDGEEIMFYMQSGGTMGEPKTVAISSRCANAMARNLLASLDDRFDSHNAMLVVLPMFHGYGLCVGIQAAICTDMHVVLQAVFNAKRTTRIIKKQGVTTMLAVPRMVQKLLDCDEFHGKGISKIEDVFVGGDTVDKELVRRFDERMRECGGKGKLSAGYGLTETASVCTVTNADYVGGSVGKPLKNVSVRIVDDDLNELPAGEVGELLVGGEQIMSGYVGDEEATKKAIVELDGVKWVRTGDYFRQDEQGRLFFMGRKKRLIKISGINVFPTEIEKVVRELPFIDECACIEYRINGKPYIKVLVEGEISDAQKQAVINHVAKRMSHWNTPRCVECVKEFPRTKIAKIDIEGLKNEFGKDTQSSQQDCSVRQS